MAPYPDNIREFVTQASVKLGDSGYDVEVEIVRRSDLVVSEQSGEQAVSIGLKEYCVLPDMGADDLFVVFDLGTVLNLDEVRFADPESGNRLPVTNQKEREQGGPVRVPVVLKDSARISLLISADNRPLGTLALDIQHTGKLADTTFFPE